MRIIILAASLAAGCFGQSLGPGGDDAGYGLQPDLEPLCVSNNDGVIDADELKYPLGLTVKYLANPSGTTVPVAPDGAPGPEGPEWDLTSTSGVVFPLTIEPVADKWFASAFPGATYATVSDLSSGTLGVFRVTPDALLLLGFASETPNQTLLVYDAPVATLKLPVMVGQSYVTGAKIVNGTLDGQPFASSDTYRISVDESGTAILPFLRLHKTLRIHVELSQAVPGGLAVTRIQYLFFHECYGELGRMVSNPGETNPSFTTAAEFRRLAL
ncbi:MAG TPA: hypothetical protein VFF06_03450 [Polyangia bacterium]|nr:hypothetical protein [Polyangia bacterium]